MVAFLAWIAANPEVLIAALPGLLGLIRGSFKLILLSVFLLVLPFIFTGMSIGGGLSWWVILAFILILILIFKKK